MRLIQGECGMKRLKQTYKIVSKHGENYELDDGRMFRYNSLQLVDVEDKVIIEDKVKVAKKVRKTAVILNRESMDEGNIRRSVRERKPKYMMVSDRYGGVDMG